MYVQLPQQARSSSKGGPREGVVPQGCVRAPGHWTILPCGNPLSNRRILPYLANPSFALDVSERRLRLNH